MMKGYLDNGSANPVVVTVANLPVSSTGYDVYVYADGSNGGGTRTGSYGISGAGITTSTSNLTDIGNLNFNGLYSAGGNYAKFSINATGFTITATPGSASDSTPRAPVNGIQIVPSSGVISDFTISPGSPSANRRPGGTASYPVTVTAANSFNGTVALNASGLPAGATASFTPLP